MKDALDIIMNLLNGKYSLTIVTIAGVVFIIFLILRIRLDLKIFKKQTRFSKLHEKKCESAGVLFSKFQKMKWAVGRYISPYEKIYEGEPSNKKIVDSYQAIWEAYEYFQCNIIYFEPKLRDDIYSFFKSVRGNIDMYAQFKEDYEHNKNHELCQNMRDLITKSDSLLDEISEKLELDFRKIIGNQ